MSPSPIFSSSSHFSETQSYWKRRSSYLPKTFVSEPYPSLHPALLLAVFRRRFVLDARNPSAAVLLGIRPIRQQPLQMASEEGHFEDSLGKVRFHF
ncbi:hypothetical protein L596_014369 [Steinernema carpocapsae]|uniref:Uncharacterized protein n=1 Tax=Steinernema carpocapsae TaxID=34508 RepID=A0A4U5NCJ4_STECR|nr:hypothetical protein L596_014369 [Steinernema carpocapsae]